MKKVKVLLVMLIMVSLIFLSCSKDSTGPNNDWIPLEPLNIYTSPMHSPYGICAVGDHLYVLSEVDYPSYDSSIYKLRKSDLGIVQQWTWDEPGYFTGITFDGTNFWLARHGSQDKIYKANQYFEILAQYNYPIPDDDMNDVYSLAWSGSHLWSTYDIGNTVQLIVKHNNDATLSVLGQWDVSGTSTSGVFFANGFLWSTGGTGIRKHNSDVSVAEHWEPEIWGDYPNYPYYNAIEKRMCYDGEFFWGCAGNNIEPYITKRQGLE